MGRDENKFTEQDLEEYYNALRFTTWLFQRTKLKYYLLERKMHPTKRQAHLCTMRKRFKRNYAAFEGNPLFEETLGQLNKLEALAALSTTKFYMEN